MDDLEVESGNFTPHVWSGRFGGRGVWYPNGYGMAVQWLALHVTDDQGLPLLSKEGYRIVSRIRLIYIALSAVGVLLASVFYGDIVSDKTAFNNFSYVGVVATFIGLLVAVFEILHELARTRSIQEESRRLLRSVKNIDHAAAVSHSLSTLDEVAVCFEREDYHGALKSFRHFRRIAIALYKRFGIDPDDIKAGASKTMGLLGELEELLSSATHTTDEAPLARGQRISFRRDVLQIKYQIENHMHFEGEGHAA